MPNKFLAELVAYHGENIHIGNVLDELRYYHSWEPGDDFISLDGLFDFEELEAIVIMARKQGYLTSSEE